MKKLLTQKRNFLLLFWPIGIGLLLWAKYVPNAAEYIFARGLYKGYSGVMTFLTGKLPFSVAEILVVAFALFMLGYLIFRVVGIVRSRGSRLLKSISLIRFLAIISGVIFVFFMIGGGTNYYRYEFTTFSDLEIRDSSKEELFELCMKLTERTNEAREILADSVKKDGIGSCEENAPYISGMTHRERAENCLQAYRKLGERYEVLSGYYSMAKPVLLSRLMSEFNITGIYFPGTVEANVNTDVPDCEKAATICHELTHLRGFMREDEANYLGYKACVESGNPELVYSGYIMALTHACNRLYDIDPILYFEVLENYSPGVNADEAEKSRYWAQFKGTVAESIGEAVNDTYLKINAQDDGTKSYGRMVDLLLAEYRNKKEGI